MFISYAFYFLFWSEKIKQWTMTYKFIGYLWRVFFITLFNIAFIYHINLFPIYGGQKLMVLYIVSNAKAASVQLKRKEKSKFWRTFSFSFFSLSFHSSFDEILVRAYKWMFGFKKGEGNLTEFQTDNFSLLLFNNKKVFMSF